MRSGRSYSGSGCGFGWDTGVGFESVGFWYTETNKERKGEGEELTVMYVCDFTFYRSRVELLGLYSIA